jgi:hypothetical protein
MLWFDRVESHIILFELSKLFVICYVLLLCSLCEVMGVFISEVLLEVVCYYFIGGHLAIQISCGINDSYVSVGWYLLHDLLLCTNTKILK